MTLVTNALTYLVPLIFFFSIILDNNMLPSFAQKPQPSEKQQSQLVPEKLGVKITYPTDGQTVPVGELTIFGAAAYNAATNDCTVYADWNDSKPMQKTMPAGMNYTEFGRANDYSTWIFTYTEKSHIISEGTNELTAKLSCDIGPFNSTKYDSVSVTGLS